MADQLCAGFGYSKGEERREQAAPERAARPWLFAELLSPEDERLVATARRSLTRIAAALEANHPKVVSETAYQALLDGTEVVMRNELTAGNPIAPLMPGFVFLIALPMVDQDEALELSRRTESLLA